jgi:hypothetical protein
MAHGAVPGESAIRATRVDFQGIVDARSPVINSLRQFPRSVLKGCFSIIARRRCKRLHIQLWAKTEIEQKLTMASADWW